MSVGITNGQPAEIAGSEFIAIKISAGKSIPPKAAKVGKKISLG
jgi:hypothetical protein